MKDLNSVKCFVFDLDGTIYLSQKLIDGIKEKLDFLREKGKKIVYLTNNSTYSIKSYNATLKSLGILTDKDLVVSSNSATMGYLKENGLTKNIYLIGTKDLKEEYRENGFSLCFKNPSTVVVGYDVNLNYDQLSIATDSIIKGANFVATHGDLACPYKDKLKPDVGSFVALLETATEKKALAVCGKPSKIMGDYLKNLLSLQSEEICMVGDSLFSDIPFGQINGFYTILVLSGKTTLKEYEEYKKVHGEVDLVLGGVKDIKL